MSGTSLLQTFIISPLLSFIFYQVAWLYTPGTAKMRLKEYGNIDRTIVNLVLICSLVMLGWMFLFPTIDLLNGKDNIRAFGPYWWAFWYYPVILMITQLLWTNRFRQSEVFKFVIGFLLIAQPFFIEKLVISITSFNRDYLPSYFSSTFSTSALGRLVISILVATLEVFINLNI